MSNNKTSRYVKMSHREHVLKRSGTYIGSKTSIKQEMYVVKDNNLDNIVVEKKNVINNPAFVKLFCEIISNASDQSIRTGKVKMIKVLIDENKISVENDGPTVPLEIHPTENVYIPEMIWSQLLTGENYDDTEEREGSGVNGLGSKLTNVFSKKFIIECCDGKQRYKQTIKNNMKDIGKPEITKVADTRSYTKITYYPDYSQFDFKTLTDDLKSIMYKRCIDVAAYIPSVRFSLNGKTLPIKKMKDYMMMHLPPDSEFFYEELKNGWKVGIAKTTTEQFENISIVNGITTYKGGTHVSHVVNRISKDISDKFKKGTNVNWFDIKNKLTVFVIAKIPNPEFDTQTKENMTKYLNVDIHGNHYVSDNTVRKIMRSEIVSSILEEIEMKEKLRLKRMQKAQKKIKVDKLIDANSKDRSTCELYIFEGDSAGNAARFFRNPDTQAIFKLKGKFVNTRKLSDKQIFEKKEALDLMSSIGLTLGEKITGDVRYDKIIITTDMDTDGDSITGLLLNFFSKWKSLFENKKVYRCITPLLAIKKGKVKKYFYTYDEWSKYQEKNSVVGWDISFKKGIGSLTDEEYKAMMENPKLIRIDWDKTSEKYLECWFGDDTDMRKKQLS